MRSIFYSIICVIAIILGSCSTPTPPLSSTKQPEIILSEPAQTERMQKILDQQAAYKKASRKLEENAAYDKVELKTGGEIGPNGKLNVLFLTLYGNDILNKPEEQLREMGKEAFLHIKSFIEEEDIYDKFQAKFIQQADKSLPMTKTTKTFTYVLKELE